MNRPAPAALFDRRLHHFPEHVNSDRLEHSELCEVADMIALALKLSVLNIGDYWDDADRWIRNMFAEGQLTRCDWIGRFALMGYEETREADVRDSILHQEYQTTDRVPERNLGAFAGWPKANDWYVGQGVGIMHCCTGNGARTLYYVWDSIVTGDASEARINLLLNRASEWLDVHSYLPAEGKLVLKIKKTQRVAARMPEWVDLNRVRATVRGKEVSLKRCADSICLEFHEPCAARRLLVNPAFDG